MVWAILRSMRCSIGFTTQTLPFAGGLEFSVKL